jgi:hypothetical protein
MIEANWGGWRNQYEMTYYFVCNHHNFFFSTYKVNRNNGKNPGDPKNWEKKEAKNRAENTHRTILDDGIIWGRNSNSRWRLLKCGLHRSNFEELVLRRRSGGVE